MGERKEESKRRGRGRSDFLQRRAERRARQRMAAAQAGAEEPRIGLLRRLGWTLRDGGWTVQEKLLWPLTDWVRIGFEGLVWQLEGAVWAIRERILWPLQDRLATAAGAGRKVPRVATLGALGAIALGALGAGALLASDADDPAQAEPEPALIAQAGVQTDDPTEPTPIVARTEPEPDQPRLKGIKPSFGPRSDEERDAARAALRKLRAEQKASADEAGKSAVGEGADTAATEETGGNAAEAGPEETDPGNEETSADSDAEAGGAVASSSNQRQKTRRRESPLNVAERFAIAFVSYEVGASGRPIETAFKDTADRDLFDSLMERPPRQPTGSKIPKARVVNVVGGPRKKNAMEVSVGLLRVDGLSEIRLDMKRLGRGWVVKTVRG